MIKSRHISESGKLTPRESEIMLWTARGKTYGEISSFLSLSQDTIKAHIESVRDKLNATNKTHAVALAIVLGHLRPEDILAKRPGPHSK